MDEDDEDSELRELILTGEQYEDWYHIGDVVYTLKDNICIAYYLW